MIDLEGWMEMRRSQLSEIQKMNSGDYPMLLSFAEGQVAMLNEITAFLSSADVDAKMVGGVGNEQVKKEYEDHLE